MSMTKGTPLSSQIIWLEERVKELEVENESLQEVINEYVELVKKQRGEINQLKLNKPESDKIENILMDSLDARYRKQIEKMSYSGDGIFTAKRSAAVYLVEELVDEVIKSSYDDNQVKLAYAIELLKRNQS